MVEFTIVRGIGLGREHFAAIAYPDSEMVGDERVTASLLLKNDPGEGWSMIAVEQDRLFALARSSEGPLATSDRRRVYTFDSGSPAIDLSGLSNGRLSAAVEGPGQDVTILGDHGYFLAGRPSTGFAKITELHEQGQISFYATEEEEEEHRKKRRFVFNAAFLSDGRLAWTQIGGLAEMSRDYSEITTYRGPLAHPVDLWPMPDGTAVAVGHSPRVVIYRFRPGTGLEPIFDGPTDARQAACISVHEGSVFVGASDPRGAGVFRLDASGLRRVTLPDGRNDLPVFDLDVVDGVLWVFRAKDVLRLSGGAWTRLAPDGSL